VLPSFEVSVTVTPSANQVCAGSSVTFTATPTHGGDSPAYLWMVDHVGTGSNSPVFSFNPANGNVVTCQLTSSLECASGNPATSEPDTMAVIPNLPVAVSITASANPVCEGTPVIFTAHPVHGGVAPSFQWKVNGTDQGANAITFAHQPNADDTITCVMTSNEICPGGNPAVSNAIIMTVSPNVPVNVVIGASENPSCAGSLVSFTATPTNGGISPVFNWFVNGTPGGINSPVFSYTPVSTDHISCIMNSSTGCPSGNPDTSNVITMTVGLYSPVSIGIVASANPSCNGIPVAFTATAVNGGSSPHFQWFVN
ncbi:MAG: hypothetical protein NTW16_04620, partial [Bacteroidetes bacterium]|nr:hypothetical protein [Bacteroidota bacterium]